MIILRVRQEGPACRETILPHGAVFVSPHHWALVPLVGRPMGACHRLHPASFLVFVVGLSFVSIYLFAVSPSLLCFLVWSVAVCV